MASVNAMDVMNNITISVKITHLAELRIRSFIARMLFRLGAAILNCEIDIE